MRQYDIEQSLQSEKLSAQQFVNNRKKSHLRKKNTYVFLYSETKMPIQKRFGDSSITDCDDVICLFFYIFVYNHFCGWKRFMCTGVLLFHIIIVIRSNISYVFETAELIQKFRACFWQLRNVRI